MEEWLHTLLTSTTYQGKWSASRPGCFAPEERAPYILCIGGRESPRVGLGAIFLCRKTGVGEELSRKRPLGKSQYRRQNNIKNEIYFGLCSE